MRRLAPYSRSADSHHREERVEVSKVPQAKSAGVRMRQAVTLSEVLDAGLNAFEAIRAGIDLTPCTRLIAYVAALCQVAPGK